MIWFKHAEHPLKSQDFVESGFSEEEKTQYERQYGKYFGTYEGLAFFGIKSEFHKKHKQNFLVGTVVSKERQKRVKVEGELDSIIDLNRFSAQQTNPVEGFTEMKIKVEYGQNSPSSPTVNILKVEKELLTVSGANSG